MKPGRIRITLTLDLHVKNRKDFKNARMMFCNIDGNNKLPPEIEAISTNYVLRAEKRNDDGTPYRKAIKVGHWLESSIVDEVEGTK